MTDFLVVFLRLLAQAHDHVQLMKCQISALRHKFSVFRKAIDISEDEMALRYTELVGLAQVRQEDIARNSACRIQVADGRTNNCFFTFGFTL